MPPEEAAQQLQRCCGATAWARAMAAARPFAEVEAVHAAADRALDGLSRADWLEAFAAHPRIGAGGGGAWSRQEQAGMDAADEPLRQRLRAANDAYVERFGYLFLICATGRGAAEMLASLEERMHNDPDTEFAVATGQQRLITHLRIDKLLSS